MTAIGTGLGLPWVAAMGGGASIPSWVLRSGATPATMDIDFLNDRAWNAGALTSVAAMLACSRASSGYYTKADGTLQNFSSNALRYGTNGLLVEAAATNLSRDSQTLSSWIPSNLTVAANSDQAPDGTTTASVLTAAIGLSPKAVYRQGAATTTLVTNSVYAKAGTVSWLGLGFDSTAVAQGAFFNLATGAIGTVAAGTVAAIEPLAAGWYRCSVSRTLAVDLHNSLIELHTADNQGSFLATGTETISVWGSQQEARSSASSYIPTTSSSATRAADAITFSDLTWFDGANDTIYAEWLAKNVNNANVWAFDATNDKALDEQTGMSARIAGATAANTVAAGAVAKAAARMKVNDFGISMNGGAAATDVSETAPGTLTASRLGADLAGANFLNSYIRRVSAFKGLAANDAALASLST